MAESSTSDTATATTKRICIIGAGASGLSSIKTLLESNQQQQQPKILFDPICYEATDDLGGLWRFTQSESSSVYRSTVINTSKEMMAFSDFPIPDDYPPFLPHHLIIQYFKKYAEHFGLLKYIHFETRVVSVVPEGDGFRVKIRDRNGTESEELFDGVMVCSGHHSKPNRVQWEGLELFRGRLLHSHYYKEPFCDEFRDRNVLVIGIGNSGGDIAVELAKNVAKQVYLSTRSGSWIIPRESLFGSPLDHIPKWLWLLPVGILSFLMERVLKLFYGDLKGIAKYLEPHHSFLSSHPTINSELVGRIRNGTVQIVPNVVKFMEDGHSVQLDNGTILPHIDTVVECTGYRIEFPFLNELSGELSLTQSDDNQVKLFKYMFHPGAYKKNLAFIGLIQPLGAIMPIAELQSRLACRVFRGEVELPSDEQMWKDIELKQREVSKRYTHSKRHTIQVDYAPYMDELAELAMVIPNYFRMLFTDTRFAVKLLHGPSYPCMYRLEDGSKLVRKEFREEERRMARETIERTSYSVVGEMYQSNPSDREKRRDGMVSVIVKAVFLFVVFVLYFVKRWFK